MVHKRGFPLRISKRESEGIQVVSLAGRLNGGNCERLRDALRELVDRGSPAILLDLSGLEYVESSGLAAFLECVAGLAGYGGRFALYGASLRIRAMIDMFRLAALLPLYSDEDQAIEKLKAASSPAPRLAPSP